MTIRKMSPTLTQKICKNIIFQLLKKIRAGHLTICLPDGQKESFGDKGSSLSADINVFDYRFFLKLFCGAMSALVNLLCLACGIPKTFHVCSDYLSRTGRH